MTSAFAVQGLLQKCLQSFLNLRINKCEKGYLKKAMLTGIDFDTIEPALILKDCKIPVKASFSKTLHDRSLQHLLINKLTIIFHKLRIKFQKGWSQNNPTLFCKLNAFSCHRWKTSVYLILSVLGFWFFMVASVTLT